MFKVFLDDCRQAPYGWITIRSAAALLEFMKWNVGKISELSLDHDLMHQPDDDDPEQDGYWFVKQMVDAWCYADTIYFHTSNPAGRENMYHYLVNAKEHGVIPPHVVIHHHLYPAGYMEGEQNAT